MRSIVIMAKIQGSASVARLAVKTLSYSESLNQADPGSWHLERKSADDIMNALRRLRCPLDLDKLTKGDGNCMVIALLQQCQRPEILPFLPPGLRSVAKDPITKDSTDYFRLAVWKFATAGKKLFSGEGILFFRFLLSF